MLPRVVWPETVDRERGACVCDGIDAISSVDVYDGQESARLLRYQINLERGI